jgi:hypothetical protein
MDIYSRVRRACFKDGMSVRVVALYFSKDPKTVAMMLGHELQPSYRSYEIRRRATLDTFIGIIDLRRSVSETFMPLYLDLNLQSDAGLRPCLRHTSAVGIPASCSLIIPIICASAKRLFRICLLLRKVEHTLHQSEGGFGGQVRSCSRLQHVRLPSAEHSPRSFCDRHPNIVVFAP